jgi:hypothetical protein
MAPEETGNDGKAPDAGKTPSVVEAESVINEALGKIGVTRPELHNALLSRLKAAGDAYERAVIPADKDFWHAEVIRLTAALHAFIG